MSGAVLKEGFLTKSPPLDSRFAQWRKRYFRLRESGHLDYYANDKKDLQDKIDGVNLGNCTGVEKLSQYEGKDKCIQVTTTDRVYVLKCSNDEELQEWYQVIKSSQEAACGITPVTVDLAKGMGGAGESPSMRKRPLPDITPDSSRPLPTLPPSGSSAGASAVAAPPPLGVTHSASFQDHKQIKSSHHEKPKPRASLPDVQAAPISEIYPTPGSSLPPTPSNVPQEMAGGRPPPRRDGYAQVDFTAKSSSQTTKKLTYAKIEITPGAGGKGERSIASPANRINYAQIDLSKKPPQSSATLPSNSSGGASGAARVSYHQVDFNKTNERRRSSLEMPGVSSAPPLPSGFDRPDDDLRPGVESMSNYVTMQQPVPPASAARHQGAGHAPPLPGEDFQTPEDYEQMGSMEPPQQIAAKPTITPRRSLRSLDQGQPKLPPKGQPVLPPRNR